MSIPTQNAISAASALLAANVDRYQEAVHVLIEQSDNPASAACELVRILLVPQESKRCYSDPNFHRVAFARDITYKYPQTAAENASRLLNRLCYYGFRPAFVELCGILQNRAPTGTEIIALTEAYVRNKAVRSENDEQSLRELAEKYASTDARAKVNRLLAAFVKEWNDAVDY